jgi:adenylosuccinate synthase
MTTIVLGSQWGDEGKGKLVDILCREAQICARAQGGHNAGHTVIVDGVSYDFHLLPSGLLNPDCMNLIGSGTVVYIPAFFEELAKLEGKGLKGARERLYVSDRCHIITDCHIQVDGLKEQQLGDRSLGTTKRGIGPTYSTMAARTGITISEMFDEAVFERKLRNLAGDYRKLFGDLLQYDVEEELERFRKYREEMRTFVVDAVDFVSRAERSGMKILVEGAQAVMLDLNFGTYPYVTSSNTGLGGVLSGLALNPFNVKRVIGVAKCYTTRVGAGPFPTEQLNEVGETLQQTGGEIGVSTGRKRRCGWLDLVVIKYSAAINHYTALNLTKLDVLDKFPKIKVAIAYKDPQTGQELPSFPADVELLSRVEVVYHEMEGWNTTTTHAKSYDELPAQAKAYVEYIEKFVGVKATWIGTGPKREDMVVKN